MKCPRSLMTFEKFYQGFLDWDLVLSGVRSPDHIFYFTLRDALNFGVQEFFGLLSSCESLGCKIASQAPARDITFTRANRKRSYLRLVEMAWPRPQAGKGTGAGKASTALEQVLQSKLSGTTCGYRGAPLALLLKPCLEGASSLCFIHCMRLDPALVAGWYYTGKGRRVQVLGFQPEKGMYDVLLENGQPAVCKRENLRSSPASNLAASARSGAAARSRSRSPRTRTASRSSPAATARGTAAERPARQGVCVVCLTQPAEMAGRE
eukprot:g30692.t1